MTIPLARRRSVADTSRLVVVASATVAMMLVAPQAANASLYLVFRPTHVSPGDVVHVRSEPSGDLPGVPAGTLLPVYLAPLDAAANITSSRDKALIRVGSLQVDKVGNGQLRFVVPRLPRGAYAGFILCGRWCAPYSAGRDFVPVAPGAVLDVSSDIPASSTNPGGISLAEELGAAGGGLVAVVAAIALGRWRSRRRATVQRDREAELRRQRDHAG